MESPTRIDNSSVLAETLSPSSSSRRFSTDSNSLEFEFWRIKNPSNFCQLELPSADELFSGGILLPLHSLSLPQPERPDPEPGVADPDPPTANRDPETETQAEATLEPAATSKRWRDIFKKSEKQKPEENEKSEDKMSKKKVHGSGSVGSAELNINIWPFRRSRSAGNNGSRPRMTSGAPVTRKVSSAPCSRSNSGGESKCRKWPSSPGRAGVHLGRSSPIWQVRRGNSGGPRSSVAVQPWPAEKSIDKSAAKMKTTRVLNLHVPMCIGYRAQHLSCKGGDRSAIAVAAAGTSNCGRRDDNNIDNNSINSDIGGSSGTNNLFKIRGLFTKKVH